MSKRWVQTLHDYDFWLIWKGEGKMVVNQKKVEIKPGLCVLMRPGSEYEAHQNEKNPLGITFIHFDVRTAEKKSLIDVSALLPEVSFIKDIGFYDSTSKLVVDILKKNDTGLGSLSYYYQSQQLFHSLLLGIVSNTGREKKGGREFDLISVQVRFLVGRILAKIHENPEQIFEVKKLAEEFNYSPDHLNRVFKKVTGKRISDYLIEHRIKRASQLLDETTGTISEIAYQLQYKTVHHFSNQFKTVKGISPRQYRMMQTGMV